MQALTALHRKAHPPTLLPHPPPLHPPVQVSPASLATLKEMGYARAESIRALRFCAGDVAAAVAFIGDQRLQQEARAAEKRKARAWALERKRYGKTGGKGVFVDRDGLDQLVVLGYQREVAAEALRASENELQVCVWGGGVIGWLLVSRVGTVVRGCLLVTICFMQTAGLAACTKLPNPQQTALQP